MAEEKDIQQEEVVQETPETTQQADVQQTDVQQETESGAEADAGKAKKTKKEKIDKEKEALKEQVAALDDRVKRQLAEFENFRNRSDREKAAMFDNGTAAALKKMLAVVDNFERGLQAVPEEQKEDPFVQGMEKVYRQLMTELENMGVTAIEAVGHPMDPNLHNAVMQQEMEGFESGVVCMELQKGYMYRDIVLRHSMVAVVP